MIRSRQVFYKENEMDPSTIRIICAVLAVGFLGLIVMRRRNKAE
jgi:hypothetical protein